MLTADSPVNLLTNGGFEAGKPAYWRAEGSGATWTTEQSRTPAYSLKLSGEGAAAWVMDEAVRNWSPRYPGNAELQFGAWVKTEGVNTNPASDEEKFQIVLEFFDVAGGTNLLGEAVVIDLPQEAASSGGWVKVDNTTLGAITLPQDAQSARITVRKGAAATGTVYVDDWFVTTTTPDVWAGDLFNANVDAGDTWYYWWDCFSCGRADWPENQPFIQTVSDEAAHTGTYSLKLEQNVTEATESVAISERVPVTAGEPVLVSFWVKTEGVPEPEKIGDPEAGDYNIGMTALWYENLSGGAAGWGEIGGVDIRLNGEYNEQVIPLAKREASTGWTQYAFVVYPKEGAVGMELRLRYWHAFEGTTYWDDVFVAPVSSVLGVLPNLLTNGGFEAGKPAYWRAEGSGATWTTEQSRTPAYSLKLSGEGAAAWVMDEAVRNWSPRFPGNAELQFGAWVKTEGVNTNPASDEEKFQIVLEFFDVAGGTNLLGEAVVIDLPQAEASSGGWVKVDNTTLGAITLPQDAQSARITVRKGAAATGTVYVDDWFVATTTPDVWAGDLFNANVDAGDTWYYWWDCFSCGEAGWPENQPFIQTVSDEAAHTGTYSLKLEQNVTEATESVAISERVPVTAGEPVLVSFWVKTEGVPEPEKIGDPEAGDYNIGMTALWYENLSGGAAGWGEIGGVDIRLNGEYNEQVIPLAKREASTGWTQYAFVVYPKEGAVGMELRLRYWHAFEGTTYWDDVSIVTLGGGSLTGTAIEEEPGTNELPGRYLLHQNYPNPFNPTTMLRFDLPEATHATLAVYNLLGQRVATLVDGLMRAGQHEVQFDASGLPSGTYLYVLRTANHVETRRMVLVK
ncbi:hypothetical protein AWN76_013995 [Rhodothermaceae bacterium RA]|nr:hypothetical protein AWN76_013995 [Rhodothermaceae bacterium RA]